MGWIETRLKDNISTILIFSCMRLWDFWDGCYRYHGSKKAAEAKLPFDAGFETVSVVAAIGLGVKGMNGIGCQL